MLPKLDSLILPKIPSSLCLCNIWSEMTLNYQMIMERYPNVKREVGGLNHDCEVFSILNGQTKSLLITR